MPFVLELLGFILSIAGIIGIIATILDWIRGILPTARLQYFDQIIIETEGFLQALGEDKIFSNPETLVHFRERLSTVRDMAEPHRWATYCATSTMQQVAGLFNGLSSNLSKLCNEAVRLRAEISTTATSERDALQSDDHVDAPAATESPQRPATHSVEREPSLDAQTGTTICPNPAHVDTTPCAVVPPPPSHPPDRVGVAQKKRHHTEQFLRRSRRILTSRSDLSRPLAQLEHSKCGITRTAEFRRVARCLTDDSVASSSTCVSDYDPMDPGARLSSDSADEDEGSPPITKDQILPTSHHRASKSNTQRRPWLPPWLPWPIPVRGLHPNRAA